MSGWVKIYREITRHWIWDNPSYFKAWISILLTVNHDDNKVLISGEVIECKRGQSLYSLEGWAKVFGKGWTKQKVRTFFNLLKSDAMIDTEGLRKTTRLTVCNYDKYQNIQHTDNTDTTHRQHTDNTQTTPNKNDKKENNENNEKNNFSEFWDSYHSITGLKKTDMQPAQKYWKQLTKGEKEKALKNIQPYYDSLNDKKYCKKARTYLSAKSYNDEFITQPVPVEKKREGYDPWGRPYNYEELKKKGLLQCR